MIRHYGRRPRGFHLFGRAGSPSPDPGPVLLSLSHDLADTAGGDVLEATLATTAGLVAFEVSSASGWESRPATVLDGARASFVMPARAAGVWMVRAVGAGGTSGGLPIATEAGPIYWLTSRHVDVVDGAVAKVHDRAAGIADWSVSQSTASKRPVYESARPSFGGAPAVVFDGVDDFLASQDVGTVAQPATHYMLVDFRTVAGTRAIFDSANRQLVRVTGGAAQVYAGGATVPSTGAILGARPTLIAAVFNGGSSSLYVDDMSAPALSGVNPGPASLRSLVVGSHFDTGQMFLDGAKAVLGALSGAHDLATRTRIANRIKAEYGLAP